jgi:hypothetical protein
MGLFKRSTLIYFLAYLAALFMSAFVSPDLEYRVIIFRQVSMSRRVRAR